MVQNLFGCNPEKDIFADDYFWRKARKPAVWANVITEELSSKGRFPSKDT